MPTPALILDSQALSILADKASVAQRRLTQALAEAKIRGGVVAVPAVVCSEVCRDGARTRAVESFLSRQVVKGVPGVQVIGTDFALAKEVGTLLGSAGLGSAGLVDAHVVAVAACFGGAVVATSDPDDIRNLASHVPAIRIIILRC
jgi:hypothetical protein